MDVQRPTTTNKHNLRMTLPFTNLGFDGTMMGSNSNFHQLIDVPIQPKQCSSLYDTSVLSIAETTPFDPPIPWFENQWFFSKDGIFTTKHHKSLATLSIIVVASRNGINYRVVPKSRLALAIMIMLLIIGWFLRTIISDLPQPITIIDMADCPNQEQPTFQKPLLHCGSYHMIADSKMVP